jgi:hypothetical protein
VRTTERHRAVARPVHRGHRGRVAPARRSGLRLEPHLAPPERSVHYGARAPQGLREAVSRRVARLSVRAAPAAVRQALPERHSAPRAPHSVHCGARALPGLRAAASRRAALPFVRAAPAAVRQAPHSAPPGAAARQAGVPRRAEPAASDAGGLLPGAADAAEVPRAALRAGAAPGARHAAEVPRAARRAEAGVAVRPAGAAEAQHAAAPGAPVALPSGAVSVFRRDRLRRLAPTRSARFARATARLRNASP